MEIILECLEDLEDQSFLLEVADNNSSPRGFVIGRATDCHLQLASTYVSRHHCELIPDEDRGGVRVRDLGSQNGTFVNDEKIQSECELRDGDRLTVACVPFEIHIPEEKARLN